MSKWSQEKSRRAREHPSYTGDSDSAVKVNSKPVSRECPSKHWEFQFITAEICPSLCPNFTWLLMWYKNRTHFRESNANPEGSFAVEMQSCALNPNNHVRTASGGKMCSGMDTFKGVISCRIFIIYFTLEGGKRVPVRSQDLGLMCRQRMAELWDDSWTVKLMHNCREEIKAATDMIFFFLHSFQNTLRGVLCGWESQAAK